MADSNVFELNNEYERTMQESEVGSGDEHRRVVIAIRILGREEIC